MLVGDGRGGGVVAGVAKICVGGGAHLMFRIKLDVAVEMVRR